ncbi:CvpA family protein [Marivirga sp. S37H4]|uniref:CvpA family protein n=1 Tax=Marivirga aurantiaca TaxID=2802615 RepID=A0A934X220_9BACT|nr:CvpA family protein [Marivirga aurantiaca]MBK6267036.1 CvpA family protein [Marivirga aurantiaca]
MKTLDILLLIPLIFGAYLGFRKGLLLEIVSLVAFVLAIVGAFKLLDFGIELLQPYFEKWDTALPIISFIVLFIAILLIVNLIGKIVKKVLDMTLLGGLDNFAGAVLGLLKWAFGVSLVLWMAESVDVSISAEMAEGTYIYPTVASFAPFVLDLFSAYLPFIQEVFDSLKSKFLF